MATFGSNSYMTNVQNQIQQDWTNREYIEIIVLNIRKITDFLNSFDLSCRTKLANLDEKLTLIEKQIDYLDAKISKNNSTNGN